MEIYFSTGYYLIKANHPIGWDWPTDLFPDKLISLSPCICPKLRLLWGWDWECYWEGVLEFGIDEDKFEDFVAWCHDPSKPVEMGGLFHSTAAARDFVQRFMANTADLHLIGVGFPQEIAELGWREKTGDNEWGVIRRVAQQLPVEPGGEVLGHEILSFECNSLGHSWVCNMIYEEPFGFTPNPHGLIEHYADAKKVYDWLAEDNLQGTRGEPEPYYIWQLIDYPLA